MAKELSAANKSGTLAIRRSKIVTLIDAQIKGAPSAATGYEVVPAPGPGKLLRFHGGFASWDFTAGVYTNIANAGAYFAYDTPNIFDPASFILNDVGSEFLGSANIRQCTFPPFTNWQVANARQVAIKSGGNLINTNIGFSIDHAGDFAGGNIANFMKVCCYYDIITL